MKLTRTTEQDATLMILVTCHLFHDKRYARLIPQGGWVHDTNTFHSAWYVPSDFAIRAEWDSVGDAAKWLKARGAERLT
jgi:hypothetical protein